MIISENQLLMLYQIAQDSLNSADHAYKITEDSRLRLINDILAQQSNKLFDVNDENKENAT